VAIDGDDIVLATLEGRWFAVEDRCSHAGCPFSSEASLEGSTIVCNCHGSEFDLATGEVRRGPAERPVRSVPARIVGEAIELDL
jgi:nitrite reductase/ring-hydroxylating ferredoxin subunit